MSEVLGTLDSAGANSTIRVEGEGKSKRWVGVLCLELGILVTIIQVSQGYALSDNLHSSIHVARSVLLIAFSFLLANSRPRIQTLSGSVFAEPGNPRKPSVDLLNEPDVSILIRRDGGFFIRYWTPSGESGVEVLPDPTGRMQRALLDIGRQLPPGQFVDERLLGDIQERGRG